MNIRLALAVMAALGFFASFVHATTTVTVYQVDNIASLRSNNTAANINVNDYANPGDGGGGTFISVGTDCSATFAGGDDGGVIIQSKMA